LEYYYLNMQIEIPISIGELIDKITILEIKYENISDSEKNKLINVELNLLNSIYKKIGPNKELEQLKLELKTINSKLWEIEDEIRILENKKIFENEFVSLARSVYITNDKRFDIKNKINKIFSSDIMEVKSYEKY
tara:strand:+ start:177 stop:581 length:405 start_codon:yes stop_codon:yes gene_type:complete